jgi:hypothetical protein
MRVAFSRNSNLGRRNQHNSLGSGGNNESSSLWNCCRNPFFCLSYFIKTAWIWAILFWVTASYYAYSRFRILNSTTNTNDALGRSIPRIMQGNGEEEDNDSAKDQQQQQPRSFSSPRLLVMTSSNCGEFTPKKWLSDPFEYGVLYDLVVFDYSPDKKCLSYIDTTHPHIRYIHKPKTYKWPAVYSLFHWLSTNDNNEQGKDDNDGSNNDEPIQIGTEYLMNHDWFFLTDDDIDIPLNSKGIVTLMKYCALSNMYICQPSLSPRSAVNMDITAYAPGEHHARATGFVEQMAPLFSRDALMQYLPYFEHLTHGWGIDALWSDISSNRLNKRIGVIDAVQIDHMRPSGVSNLYKRVGGIDKAEKERNQFKQAYRISEDVFTLMTNGHKGKGEKIILNDNTLPLLSING